MKSEKIGELYGTDDMTVMQLAEKARTAGASRIEEIRNYARQAGLKRIGIANCIGFQKEAEILKSHLSDEFETVSIDCKYGKIPRSELLGTPGTGFCCNPSGQAAYLAEQQTELNISFGLCLGHDILFNRKSKAPVTTLIVKDKKYNHNPYQYFSEMKEKTQLNLR